MKPATARGDFLIVRLKAKRKPTHEWNGFGFDSTPPPFQSYEITSPETEERLTQCFVVQATRDSMTRMADVDDTKDTTGKWRETVANCKYCP